MTRVGGKFAFESSWARTRQAPSAAVDRPPRRKSATMGERGHRRVITRTPVAPLRVHRVRLRIESHEANAPRSHPHRHAGTRRGLAAVHVPIERTPAMPPDHALEADVLGLQTAVPMSDGIYTSPVVADGRVYVVDGAGRCSVFRCGDAEGTLDTLPARAARRTATMSARRPSRGNTCTSAQRRAFTTCWIARRGAVVAEIDCQEPVFSTPVVGAGPGLLRHARRAGVCASRIDGAVGVAVGLREGSRRFQWQSLEWRGLGRVLREPSQGDSQTGNQTQFQRWPRDVEGSLRLLARHLPRGKTVVVPAGGRTLVPRRHRRRTEASRDGRDSRVVGQGVPRDLRPERG